MGSRWKSSPTYAGLRCIVLDLPTERLLIAGSFDADNSTISQHGPRAA
jgi:hypothetical protein